MQHGPLGFLGYDHPSPHPSRLQAADSRQAFHGKMRRDMMGFYYFGQPYFGQGSVNVAAPVSPTTPRTKKERMTPVEKRAYEKIRVLPPDALRLTR